MKVKKREAMVAVCILLIAWNLSGGLETLPADQHPASLALSLRKRRRRPARVLHISFTQQHVTYRLSTVQHNRGEVRGHIWRMVVIAFHDIQIFLSLTIKIYIFSYFFPPQ